MAQQAPRLKPSGQKGAGQLVVQQPDGFGDDGRLSSTARGYGYRWQKARKGFLNKHPLCAIHQLEGRLVASEVVDHWYPHRGLKWLFWTRALWVPMTKAWHDEVKQRLEARGEAALDEMAMQLGLTPLSLLEPERVQEWRAAAR
ncbi:MULTISPECIES: hypothetical protein [Hyphomonas]|uniref:HNH endonuclease n=1 Tax=Hyphomonas adhaerens TaxID=81029 RepID=A0A3B9GX14_9PROT|nr:MULTISPECIES: hypothetical protein [Hyphomonas]MBB40969.1 HNH endonuclease [Hyphomonas sp.]HAE26534.1 HNH endonuclease [Hyphomonas adhaerens]|tara:strand:- start:1406 stop:1837 length:432 start_codon:yes stop_codon:yes gene_type:complete